MYNVHLVGDLEKKVEAERFCTSADAFSSSSLTIGIFFLAAALTAVAIFFTRAGTDVRG